MEEIICYTRYLPKGEQRKLTFMELLLDDRWADGRIECPESFYSQTGNINGKLAAKQNYEFLLRAAQKYPLRAVGDPEASGSERKTGDWEEFRTDAYVAGKYKQELLASDYFNPVIESLLENASHLPDPGQAVKWLEKMISHGEEYYEIDDDTRPILVYRQSNLCYNTLMQFADEMTAALRRYRQVVEVFDIGEEDHQALGRYIGRRFKAVIGMQSYAFSIKMQDEKTNLHDLIIGPKYNMIFDHPVLLKKHIENGPGCYFLLTHDRNYLEFAKKYYKNIKDCIYVPPGGMLPEETRGCYFWSENRKYDISFVGTYINYRGILAEIYKYDFAHRCLAAHYMRRMRRRPNETAEKSLEYVLEKRGLKVSQEEFLTLLFQLRDSFLCVMNYFREKIIESLLSAGIEIHVYGDTWNYAPFAGHPCLHRHPELNIKESMKVLQESKISLNIMSWHKDGMTERVLNSMLCQSVVLSDWSRRLEEEFGDGEGIVLFNLEQLGHLPEKVKELLGDDAYLERIADNGYQKAVSGHLWKNRAGRFLELNDQHRMQINKCNSK